jgi:hypothetical protein
MQKIQPVAAMTEQRKKNLNDLQGLYFPSTIGHHAMILNFKSYAYGGSAHMSGITSKSIILPLPKNLQDNLSVKVGGDELGILGTLSAEMSQGATKFAGDLANAQGRLASMFGAAKQEAEDTTAAVTGKDAAVSALGKSLDTAQFLARAGMGGIAPDIAKGIGASTGTAINPYATLVFQGVDLKVHNFEWLLSPDTKEEADTLRQIIRTIQSEITPQMEGVTGESVSKDTLGRGLLKYPSMVDCFFHGIDSRFFFQMKTCMISQFNVDYAPNGIALNKGGKPSAVRLTMVMTEAAIHTKADYQPDGTISTETLAERNSGDGQADPSVDPSSVAGKNSEGGDE